MSNTASVLRAAAKALDATTIVARWRDISLAGDERVEVRWFAGSAVEGFEEIRRRVEARVRAQLPDLVRQVCNDIEVEAENAKVSALRALK